MKWAELQPKLAGMLQSPDLREIARVLATLDEPTREQAIEEIRYNLGGDVVEHIECILNGLTEVSQ